MKLVNIYPEHTGSFCSITINFWLSRSDTVTEAGNSRADEEDLLRQQCMRVGTVHACVCVCVLTEEWTGPDTMLILIQPGHTRLKLYEIHMLQVHQNKETEGRRAGATIRTQQDATHMPAGICKWECVCRMGWKRGRGFNSYTQYVITYQMKQEGCINQRWTHS